jgi:hypothetical protein
MQCGKRENKTVNDGNVSEQDKTASDENLLKPVSGGDRDLNGYGYFLYPPAEPSSFPPGTSCFVKEQYKRATVIRAHEIDRDIVVVKMDEEKRIKDVRKQKLSYRYATNDKNKNIILVTPTTTQYRNLARSQPNYNECCIDIGSSYGVCTNLMAKSVGAERVLGIDISEQLIAKSRESYSTIRFELCNVMEERKRFISLVKEFILSTGSTSLCCFVDIGGDRARRDLALLLPFLESTISPRLIIVKSKELHESLGRHINSLPPRDTVALDPAYLFPTLVPDCQIWLAALAQEAVSTKLLKSSYLHQTELGLQPRSENKRLQLGLPPSTNGASCIQVSSSQRARFSGYPLDYPRKRIPEVTEGTLILDESFAGRSQFELDKKLFICRYRNFGTCLKQDACPFDHNFCYVCGARFHVAQACFEPSAFGMSDNLALLNQN